MAALRIEMPYWGERIEEKGQTGSSWREGYGKSNKVCRLHIHCKNWHLNKWKYLQYTPIYLVFSYCKIIIFFLSRNKCLKWTKLSANKQDFFYLSKWVVGFKFKMRHQTMSTSCTGLWKMQSRKSVWRFHST